MTTEELYEQHRPWLPTVLQALCAHLPNEILQRFADGELEQAAEIGLWKAAGAKTFDPGTASFRTYAQRAIRNQIISEIRRIVRNDERYFTNVFGPTFTHELLEETADEE
jgi:DNA-directed RNA polymerase specialized sigma subunit